MKNKYYLRLFLGEHTIYVSIFISLHYNPICWANFPIWCSSNGMHTFLFFCFWFLVLKNRFAHRALNCRIVIRTQWFNNLVGVVNVYFNPVWHFSPRFSVPSIFLIESAANVDNTQYSPFGIWRWWWFVFLFDIWFATEIIFQLIT